MKIFCFKIFKNIIPLVIMVCCFTPLQIFAEGPNWLLNDHFLSMFYNLSSEVQSTLIECSSNLCFPRYSERLEGLNKTIFQLDELIEKNPGQRKNIVCVTGYLGRDLDGNIMINKDLFSRFQRKKIQTIEKMFKDNGFEKRKRMKESEEFLNFKQILTSLFNQSEFINNRWTVYFNLNRESSNFKDDEGDFAQQFLTFSFESSIEENKESYDDDEPSEFSWNSKEPKTPEQLFRENRWLFKELPERIAYESFLEEKNDW